MKRQTQVVRAGIGRDRAFGAVTPPIYLSSTYLFHEFDRKGKYDYSRSGNPTRDLLAELLADLEGGTDAVVTSSGMAAVTLALQLLKPEDLLVAPHDCYGGSYRLFDVLASRGAFRVSFIDQSDPVAVLSAIDQQPRMVWIETPSNPLLRVVDIAALCTQFKPTGAWVMVDNTFLSPVFQQPLTLGADMVLHSSTKYINGHSDVIAGALICKERSLAERLRWWANCIGVTGSAMDSYLVLRGARTLYVRMRQHEENAAEIVDAFEGHPAVDRVYHPSLAAHPGHAIARRQQSGFGGVLSVQLRGGIASVKAFLGKLELFALAESLGGVESLVSHPATMTHAGMAEDARKRAGISDSMLRFSVGLEDADDLVRDVRRALDEVVIDLGRDSLPTAPMVSICPE